MSFYQTIRAGVASLTSPGSRTLQAGHTDSGKTKAAASGYVLQFGCLVIYCFMLFLNIGDLTGGTFFEENYMIFPGLIFLGASLSVIPKTQARFSTIVGLLLACWCFGVCLLHRFAGAASGKIQDTITAFILGVPFAAVTHDSARKKGLTIVAWMFTAECLYYVACGFMLQTGTLPEVVQSGIFFGEKYMRLQIIRNSNIVANLLMIGMACWMTFGIGSRSAALPAQIVRYLVCGAMFYILSLTNCRTIIFLTAALAAGVCFFKAKRRFPQKKLVGLLLAGVVLVGVCLAAAGIFEVHCRYLAAYRETHPVESVAAVSEEEPDGGRSLANDAFTLTGRTGIWQSAFNAIKTNPKILLWGSDDVEGTLIEHYNRNVSHAHNSYLQSLMALGIPGFLLVLVMCWFALRDTWFLLTASEDRVHRGVSMICLAMMASGMLEPILFSCPYPTQFSNFFFCFCFGYLEQWYHELHHRNA